MVLTLVIVIAWDAFRSVQLSCGSRISYNGEAYDFKASSKLLSLELSRSTEAVEALSDTLQIYLDQAQRNCELHRAEKLSDDDYQNAIDDLGHRFGELVSLQETISAQEVGPLGLDAYSETLSDLRRPDRERPLEFNYSVFSGGKVLGSGDTLRSGDRFRLEIVLPETVYLYVVMLDADNNVSRLYPTSETGQGNPVAGRVGIPASEELEFELDNRTGVEKIFIFAQRERSSVIENQIPPIGSVPSTRGSEALGVAILTRGAFVSMSEPTSGEPDHVLSQIGAAATTFLIDHR